MKHFLMFAIISVSCLAGTAGAQLRLSPHVLQFGVMKPGDGRTGTVVLTNTGGKSIRVQEAKVSCPICTSVQFSPTTLRPGQKIKVKIHFAPPTSELGLVQRDVAFISDSPTLLPPKVWIQAYLTNSVGLWPATLLLHDPQKPGTEIRKTIDVVNVSDKPVTLQAPVQPHNAPMISFPKTIPAGQTVHVALHWTLPATPGEYSGDIKVPVREHPNQIMDFTYDATVRGRP